LVKILATEVGDSNFDYQFTSGDLVVVFTAGEYEDSVENNSTWQEGDWNGDFDFSTGDFVLTFTTGGYDDGKYYDVGKYDANWMFVLGADGKPDILPIWAIDVTFTGTINFYLPSWG
jgi:hypothetical protein